MEVALKKEVLEVVKIHRRKKKVGDLNNRNSCYCCYMEDMDMVVAVDKGCNKRRKKIHRHRQFG